MLPVPPPTARSLTAIAPDLIGAVTGGSDLGVATSAVLFVIDGLGADLLRAHTGHARRLSQGFTKKATARTVFPSTTAAALTSMLTGVRPGEHGLVGYRVLDPSQDRLVNQLSGWEQDGIVPETWQRADTLFQRATDAGVEAFAVGPGEYAGSGFSRAILRGATYVAAESPADRVVRAVDLAASGGRRIVYCYLPEVDKVGHKRGVDSDAWLHALEEIDGAFAPPMPAGVGGLITADHGMVDVPKHRHVLLERGDRRLDGVRHLGGEPRMLHLYLEPGVDVDATAEVWAADSADAAWVMTRTEAIAAGLFGAVTADVVPRIGDVLVAARGRWAFYDDRLADKRSQAMVGQHGSLTDEETTVPYIRTGAFAS